jgi:hypothetical protein
LQDIHKSEAERRIMRVEELMRRVERLERSCATQRKCLAFAGVALLGVSVVALRAPEEPLRVRGVMIVDEEGKERASLTATGLAVTSKDGRATMGLRCVPVLGGEQELMEFYAYEGTEVPLERRDALSSVGLSLWRRLPAAATGPKAAEEAVGGVTRSRSYLWMGSTGESNCNLGIECSNKATLSLVQTRGESDNSVSLAATPEASSIVVGPHDEKGGILLQTGEWDGSLARVLMSGGPPYGAGKEGKEAEEARDRAARWGGRPNVRCALTLGLDGHPSVTLVDSSGKDIPEQPR